MAQLKRILKCTDRLGFHYDVSVEHNPQIGVSIAYFEDREIARREYGICCREPQSDNDREWEDYEHRLT